jgi:hypothetical protein
MGWMLYFLAGIVIGIVGTVLVLLWYAVSGLVAFLELLSLMVSGGEEEE